MTCVLYGCISFWHYCREVYLEVLTERQTLNSRVGHVPWSFNRTQNQNWFSRTKIFTKTIIPKSTYLIVKFMHGHWVQNMFCWSLHQQPVATKKFQISIPYHRRLPYHPSITIVNLWPPFSSTSQFIEKITREKHQNWNETPASHFYWEQWAKSRAPCVAVATIGWRS